jgi:hypothetical protein
MLAEIFMLRCEAAASPQGPTPQCNNYQCRQPRFGSADGGDSGECSARAGSLERVMPATGRRNRRLSFD